MTEEERPRLFSFLGERCRGHLWVTLSASVVVSALLGHNEVKEAAEVRIVGQGTLSLGAVVHTANQQTD